MLLSIDIPILRLVLLILVIVGAINWGLVRFLNVNLVSVIARLAGPSQQLVESIIYGVVAGSGALLLVDKNTYKL